MTPSATLNFIDKLGHSLCPLIKVVLDPRTKSKTFKKNNNTAHKNILIFCLGINSFIFIEYKYFLKVTFAQVMTLY
jgi:hypothetical protein